ncbi:dimethyladenosine transferase 2, mitochondrial [Patagioenas fasciata monilis]|uniref:rRNA adenine N(6)-methyltransferase n=1 Tax=Patagioenas fasciata monilis TaxID=372326 RepID=A0A1V4JKE3_PATFA|nr:dimethyladenosine transferase 2, mitochondrial [Patagioenas fasciata monilis]
MLAGRAPPGAADCCRRLLAATLRPLLCGLPLCWATARRAAGQWPSPGLRLPEAAEVERLVQQAQRGRASLHRFIACPQLARTVQRCLQSGTGPQPVLLEFAPGPGVLTRTLLNAGVKVVALESNSAFLPNLQSLENSLDGQLKVIYGDFFRLDPLVPGALKPPAMCSNKLFETIGVAAVPWMADVPVKVFGILPQKTERNMLWRLLFALYECNSIYKYGRVELNLFISEKEYKVLTAKPGEPRAYQALTVLWQLGCEIQLLHMEPWSSFVTNLKNGGLWIPKSVFLPNDHLCLVRLTPQQNLFTGGLKPTNATTFIFVVKQCLAKPKSRLTDRLHSWSLDDPGKLLRQLEIPRKAQARDLYPEDYKHLFEALQNSNLFIETWFHDEALESIRNINL